MSGRTISAYANEDTARAVERIAEQEDRSPAQIAAAALRFYIRLPAEAHAALRRVEKQGTDQDIDELTREIARKAVDAEWTIAHRRFISEMTPAQGRELETEDEFLAEGVRLTR